MWNDNYNEWDDLRNLFVQGALGSKIIVTTRKESVALMMGNDQISMDNLSIEVSWSLFKRHAFENMDPMEHPELEDVGKQIAAKCKGLPLALKTLAGMLRSKSEAEEWKRVLRSQIWELPHNDILPALMLSYNDLPPDLKRCFAFCAIYPKDYQFCKDQVIYLWIANGLVKQFHLGNQYFMELISRSLFERVPEREGFLMHDLVNDLAQHASSKLCIRLEESQASHMLEQCRHLSYSMGYDDEFEKLTPLDTLEQLRTLLPIRIGYSGHLGKRVLHNILPRLRSLRALSLSHYRIKELPDELFIKLKLLRFLDISETWIKKLPHSICVLYNLETLLLSSCAYLEELPLQMEKLINLRHLDISNTPRLKMPLHLSKLKSLQMLVGAKFLVGVSRMEDLGDVQNFYGSLSVLELQNVVDRREAAKAKMREKNHVDKLSLEWSESYRCPNLTRFLIPSATETLRIFGCENVQKLSVACGNLPSVMTDLSIGSCSNLKWLPDRMQELLSSLKELNLRNCPEIESFPEGGLPFNLQVLVIENCTKLVNRRKEWRLPCLRELSIHHDVSDEEILGWELPSSIQKLWVHNLKTLSSRLLKSLTSLSLKGNVPQIQSLLEQGQLPSSLSELHSLGLCHLSSLQSLCILNCPNLQSISGSPLSSSLSRLTICYCPNLQSLPVNGMPSSLSELQISSCPLLTPQLEFDKGEYWPNIAHIPNIIINGQWL